MTTQTLRGMATHGSLHWRGDKVDGLFGLDDCPGGDAPVNTNPAACSEEFAFLNFIEAFEGLVGKEGTISVMEMEAFRDFALDILLPPEPPPTAGQHIFCWRRQWTQPVFQRHYGYRGHL